MSKNNVDVNSLELPTKTAHGIRYPFLFEDEHFEEAFSFRPHDDDIVLSTYPKSGTNWAIHIVLNLLNPNDFDGDIAKAQQSCPFIELVGTKALKPGSFFMTHLPFNVETFNPNAKYIIVLRDPRDVAVSYYHFSTQVSNKFADFPGDVYWFPRYAELFVNGEIWYGDYMEYHREKLEGLRKYGKPENILYVVYEKMKKDPRGEITRIANFLGGLAAEQLKDEEVLEKISKRTSFEFMRESNDKILRKGPGTDQAVGVSQAVRFVRKGVVGDHVNYFTPYISEIFNRYILSDPRNKEIMALFDV